MARRFVSKGEEIAPYEGPQTFSEALRTNWDDQPPGTILTPLGKYLTHRLGQAINPIVQSDPGVGPGIIYGMPRSAVLRTAQKLGSIAEPFKEGWKAGMGYDKFKATLDDFIRAYGGSPTMAEEMRTRWGGSSTSPVSMAWRTASTVADPMASGLNEARLADIAKEEALQQLNRYSYGKPLSRENLASFNMGNRELMQRTAKSLADLSGATHETVHGGDLPRVFRGQLSQPGPVKRALTSFSEDPNVAFKFGSRIVHGTPLPEDVGYTFRLDDPESFWAHPLNRKPSWEREVIVRGNPRTPMQTFPLKSQSLQDFLDEIRGSSVRKGLAPERQDFLDEIDEIRGPSVRKGLATEKIGGK